MCGGGRAGDVRVVWLVDCTGKEIRGLICKTTTSDTFSRPEGVIDIVRFLKKTLFNDTNTISNIFSIHGAIFGQRKIKKTGTPYSFEWSE
jgi:hypothetical protein